MLAAGPLREAPRVHCGTKWQTPEALRSRALRATFPGKLESVRERAAVTRTRALLAYLHIAIICEAGVQVGLLLLSGLDSWLAPFTVMP